MTKPTIKYSIGFYLIEGFWADKKPDYTKFNSQYWIKPEFWKLMEEEIVCHRHGDAEIRVYRDGLITYSDTELSTAAPDSETFTRIEKYIEILNAIFVVFVSTFTQATKIKYHTNFEVNHNQLVPIVYKNGVQVGMGMPQKSMTISQIDKRLLNNVPSGYEDSLDNWIDSPSRAVIPKEVIESSCKTFFAAAANRQQTRMLARSNKASAEFANTSFSDCILICWLQIEIYLFNTLKTYMKNEGPLKFNKERRESMLKSTSSQVIEVLELSGNLTKEVYDLLSKIRRVRNKIVHSNYSSNVNEAADALTLMELIIEENSGETIKLNTGISVNLF